MNLQNPKKFKMLIDQAHEVALIASAGAARNDRESIPQSIRRASSGSMIGMPSRIG